MNEKRTETMKNLPVSERPYEKAMDQGVEVLSDAELLAVILRTGTKDISARALAEKILTLGDPPGLPGLLHHTLPDYKAVRGIGNVKAIQLAAVGELSRRIWKAVRSGRELVFDHPAVIADYFMEELRHKEQEHLIALFLNTKNKLLREKLMFKGTVNASIISPREIFLEALEVHAVQLVLVHNHPSGDPAPSLEDIRVTKRISKGGELLGIQLLDHVIIGDRCYSSLRERGILSDVG